ncbi:unnamed protein product [Cyprideis torosa]|uniref:Uncharacterized protein n=1 Tax=Cyprideis torosa TaxID=163714 RepID=A0A7R8WVZ1_9CRUS|nr:unnamed protein product [Cyprideis torosa]CAG0907990.1 unnamed protein product [Cyprideis torosa]
MNRAPVYVFKDALESRKFGDWIKENLEEIKKRAESTSSVAELKNIEQYGVSKMRWLRFNYLTGDAAGQNMVTKATREACLWINENSPFEIKKFSLASGMDTDKKYSLLNSLHTRGKKVVAEIVLPKDILKDIMHVDVKDISYLRTLSILGSQMAGAANNGAHSPNALAAMFIATGQDVANLAESSSAYGYGEILDNGDFYYSITLPSLIVATYGGGTGLPTQKECLEIMDCYGKGKVNKLAEIMAAVVLCGEFSLAAAVAADEWVSSHEKYGRNR